MTSKNEYIINDYLDDDYNKRYSWYEDVLKANSPRYKLWCPRPYDDADYFWANSFDGENWYIYFGGKKVMCDVVVGVDDTRRTLINLNRDIKSNMIYN